MSKRNKKSKGKKSRRGKQNIPGNHVQSPLEQLKRRLAKQDIFKNMDMVPSESLDMAKISDVLSDFIEPYKHLTNTEEQYRKLITIAIVAWNAASETPDQRAEMLEIVRKTMPDQQSIEDFDAIIAELIERKQIYFHKDKRLIVDYELIDEGKAYRLSVAAFVKAPKE